MSQLYLDFRDMPLRARLRLALCIVFLWKWRGPGRGLRAEIKS
jgi:hypothetical protein